MNDEIETVKRMYDCFNARDIDGVLAVLADDVAWANAMEGGHVHGRDGVRAYWTRQWAVVRPCVEPLRFAEVPDDGAIVVAVQQSVHDLDGRPLEGQTYGLKDKTIEHVFYFRHGRVTRFDVRD